MAALVLVSLVNLLNYFDRTIVTVVAEPIKAEFTLSDTQLGFLTGPAFISVYLVMTLVFGRIVDRFSRKSALMLVLGLWSGMTFLAGFARSHFMLLLARAGVGVGEGGASPASMSIIADYFPPERRSFASAVWNAVGMVGILLSFLVGGWVAQTFGWRAAFFVAGLPGLLLLPVIALYLREPARGAMDRDTAKTLAVGPSLALLSRNSPYRWVVLATGLATFGNLGILQWLPLFFVRSHGMDLKDVGMFFGPAVSLGLIAGMLVGGWIGNRLARRSIGHMIVLGVAACFAMVPAYWIVLWMPSTSGALAVTFVAAAVSTSHAGAIAAVIQSVTPVATRGLGIAIFSFSNALIAQGILPFLVGVLSDAFAPTHGKDALRMALTVCLALLAGAGLMYARARAVTIRAYSRA